MQIRLILPREAVWLAATSSNIEVEESHLLLVRIDLTQNVDSKSVGTKDLEECSSCSPKIVN